MPTISNDKLSNSGINKQRAQFLFNKWDPSGGFDGFNWVLSQLFGNHKGGEENEYYAAYLDLPNRVPKMNPSSKTEWDDQIEKEKRNNNEPPSQFFGTTPRMDLAFQALADSTNLGKISRNYNFYKSKNPKLISKEFIDRAYKASKEIMENPNKWQQAYGDNNYVITNPEGEIERNPLGMLGKFGIKWSPEEKAIYIHDTYDFPLRARLATSIPQRRREMKIRGKVSFDPQKGSIILRDNLQQYQLPDIDNASK